MLLEIYWAGYSTLNGLKNVAAKFRKWRVDQEVARSRRTSAGAAGGGELCNQPPHFFDLIFPANQGIFATFCIVGFTLWLDSVDVKKWMQKGKKDDSSSAHRPVDKNGVAALISSLKRRAACVIKKCTSCLLKSVFMKLNQMTIKAAVHHVFAAGPRWLCCGLKHDISEWSTCRHSRNPLRLELKEYSAEKEKKNSGF